MNGSPNDVLSQLTPEMLQQILETGSLDEKGKDLDERMAQAQALLTPSSVQHVSPFGAALGGVANVINAVRGGMQTKDLRTQKDALDKQKAKDRQLYADLLLKRYSQNPIGVGAVGGAPVQQAQLAGPQPQGPVAGTTPYGAGPYGYTPGGQ